MRPLRKDAFGDRVGLLGHRLPEVEILDLYDSSSSSLPAARLTRDSSRPIAEGLARGTLGLGGEPVITGTRVPARTIASLIEMGETHEVLREDYPYVPEEAYSVAVLWVHANRCRGRPVRSWDEAGSRPAPKAA